MKKLKCILVCVICFGVVLSAMVVKAMFPQQGTVSAMQRRMTTLKKGEYFAADDEYLKYYGLERFETTLPVLFIDTQGNQTSKENKVWGSIAVLNQREDKAPQSIDTLPNYSSPITVKNRGASSYINFDKEQFRIEFYNKKGGNNPRSYELLGMDAHNEWVLNGPFLDKTLIRNRLMYSMAEQIFPWAPDARYTELFVDGEYKGVYLAVEPVTNGVGRLRLSEFGLLSGETSYILKRERLASEDMPLEVYGKTMGKTSNDLYINYPSIKKITDKQIDYITRDISEFEEVLYSDKFADPEFGYAKYIDVDCFVDYVVFNEATMNNDAGNLSTYIYKELGGKLQIAVWDFNNAYDNYQWFTQDYSDFFLRNAAWFHRLLQDKAFVDKVIARYTELRQGVLSTNNIYNNIDEYQKELGDAVDRNFAVWGYSFKQNLLSGSGRDLESYKQAITQLKFAVDKRLTFLDNNISEMYSYCIN